MLTGVEHIAVNWRRAVSLSLAGCAFLVACTHSPPLRSAPIREVEDVRRRTVPNGGRLLSVTEPAKNEYGIRATWKVSTRFDSQAYVRWLKNQFPEYRVVSETASTLSLTKQSEADSYSLQVSATTSASETVAEVTFAARAD
jgi:hypothetical protein